MALSRNRSNNHLNKQVSTCANMEKQQMILNKLSTEFPDIKCELTQPPLFIQSLLGYSSDVNIILCYKVGQNESNTFYNDTLKSSIAHQEEESLASVVGQPLIAPYSMDESVLSLTICKSLKEVNKQYCFYSPLTLNETLGVKGFCNLKLKANIPVVILCDGEVKVQQCVNKWCTVRRVLHGCIQTDKGNSISRFWTDYTKIQSNSLPPLSELVRSHISKIGGSKERAEEIDVKFRSKSVLSCIENANDGPTKCCSISALLEWSSLTVKPLLNSSTNISLIVDISLDQAPSMSISILWKQLVLLQNYLKLWQDNNGTTIKHMKLPSAQSLVESMGLKYEAVTESNIKSIVDNLLNVKVSTTCNKSELSAEKQITLTECVDTFAHSNNQLNGLTHSLWLKLLACETYEILHLFFTDVLKDVCSSPMARCVKLRSNTRFIRLVSSGAMASSRFFDPIEYFIEIGIDKLCQTLLKIFEAIKIPIIRLGMPNVRSYTDISSKEEWVAASNSWLSWICRMYSSLNILYCAEIALMKPSLPDFYPVISNVINSLSVSSGNPCDEIASLPNIIEKPQRSFTIDLSAFPLNSSPTINTDKFDEWSLSLTSNGTRKGKSIFYRSIKCPLPHLSDDDQLPKGESDNVTLMNATNSTTVDFTNLSILSENISYELHCFESHFISDNFCLNS